MIDLKEFVTETIKQVVEGAKEAGHYLKENVDYEKDGYFQIGNGTMQKIDFDISVTSSESSKTEGKAGISIKVLDFGIKDAGGESSSSINKIKFSVPIAIPEMANKKVDPLG